MLKEKTKLLFADALKEMLEKNDFQSIRITDLCNLVGCQRKTFYYHFEDKYQLSAWMYIHMMQEVWNPEKGPYNFRDNYIKGMERIRKDIVFYRKVLPDEALSGVYKHIVRYGDQLFAEMIQEKGGVVDDTLKFVIHYTSLAQICVIREWIFSNGEVSSAKLVDQILDCFPSFLKKYLMNEELLMQ